MAWLPITRCCESRCINRYPFPEKRIAEIEEANVLHVMSFELPSIYFGPSEEKEPKFMFSVIEVP